MLFRALFIALEWLGNGDVARHVELHMSRDQCSLRVLSQQKVVLRVVDLSRHSRLLIWLSSDKNRNHVSLHVPHECDLV